MIVSMTWFISSFLSLSFIHFFPWRKLRKMKESQLQSSVWQFVWSSTFPHSLITHYPWKTLDSLPFFLSLFLYHSIFLSICFHHFLSSFPELIVSKPTEASTTVIKVSTTDRPRYQNLKYQSIGVLGNWSTKVSRDRNHKEPKPQVSKNGSIEVSKNRSIKVSKEWHH